MDWTKEELERHYVGKMKVVTIPVNVSFSGRQRILEMNELEDILRSADFIAQGECDCRKKFGKCVEPMDGCLSLNDEAREIVKATGSKQISLSEALESMRRTYEAGLVHMAYTFEGEDQVGQICSCCSCCCHSMSAALRFGYSDHVISSKFVASNDGEKCIDCGTCVERCQFGAREIIDGRLVYRGEKCFGCGLCAAMCPEEAIGMISRK